MALFTLNNSAFNMKTSLLWSGGITARTKTAITFSNGTNTTIFTGNFTYNSANVITSGTITGYQQLVSGVAQLTVTGLNYSALSAQSFWNSGSGNKTGLSEALFAGNDTINGTAGNDVLYGGVGHDTINGGGGNDVIHGGGGNDVITSGAGNDTIYAGDYARITGGAGDDRYIVNAATVLITELAAGGTDTVETNFSYTLAAELENLTLTGTANATGTGNAANNVINGNAGNNLLLGNAGNDTLTGGDGNDTLTGGLGNDMFVFDKTPSAFANFDSITDMSTTDVIALDVDAFIELSNSITNPTPRAITSAELLAAPTGGGTVTAATRIIYDQTTGIISYDADGNGGSAAAVRIGQITSSVKPVLTAANFSVVTFVAAQRTGNDNLLGTTGDDRLSGYAGNDTIDGLAGNDTLYGGSGDDIVYGRAGNDILQGSGNSFLYGGTGNDTFIVDATTVTVVENASEGTDTVQSSVNFSLLTNLENLTLTGTAALTGVGNSAANIIVGNSAANLIAGGLGNDTLTGGAGADTFLFNSAPGGTNVDTITDFTAGSDKFAMQIVIFPQLQLATETVPTARALDPTQFMLSTGVATAATRIIYNQTTGAVSYDSDGSGAAAPVQIAVIGNLPVLTDSDFSLVL